GELRYDHVCASGDHLRLHGHISQLRSADLFLSVVSCGANWKQSRVRGNRDVEPSRTVEVNWLRPESKMAVVTNPQPSATPSSVTAYQHTIAAGNVGKILNRN